MIRTGRDLARGFRRDADLVVVGTGAGGAMVAAEAARAGLEVVALEEGGFHTSRDFNQREDEMLSALFKDRAGRGNEDLSIRVLQGRGVGGSTVHNQNLCKRTPPEILDDWRRRFGVGADDVGSSLDAVERLLSVRPMTDGDVNPNNDVFRRGVEALGWRGTLLSHNREGCVRSGFCELGCSFDAKQNALKVLVPRALEAGADVLADCRVDRVLVDRGRAAGVEGRVLLADRPAGSFRVRARAVCLAGSAVGSAALAIRSALPDPHRQAGRHLHLHPGSAVIGHLGDPVHGWAGIPQSFDCTEWLDLSPGSDRRVWLVPAFAHPIGFASTLPGFGRAHRALMERYPHLAVAAAMVHDETEGEVVVEDGATRIRYWPEPDDRRQLLRGLGAASRILLAGGAERVFVPGAPPREVRTDREARAIERGDFGPHEIPLTAVHPMGTLRMSARPQDGAVDPDGLHHHVRGLWVADGSLFPTSLGVPPQMSIYAFAHRIAGRIAASPAR